MTKSPHVDHAVQLAIAAGNSVKEISEGWSKVQQVVHMTSRLTADLRKEIERQEPTLRYWSAERTPHNPAEEGFLCEVYAVGLSFPRG